MILQHKIVFALAFFVAIGLWGADAPCRAAAVWQWSIPVKGGMDKGGAARAFLWIPPSCRKVRGVVIGQNNMEEEMILENPRFRKAMADMDFAEIWVAPAFSLLFRFDQGAGEVFNGMMDDLAAASGYQELAYDPIIPIGHSAAASWPYYFAVWDPGRTIAALSISGQWPYFRSPVFAPDIWGNRTLDDIPCLETMGEYESAATWSTEGLKERQEHPHLALSMAAGPAQSHFIAASAKIDYLILYIQKAVQYRVPKGWKGGSAPKLIPIDPTKTGWLADKWRKDQPPTAPPAPVGHYQGDPTQAFWYFDKEMADATEAYEAVDRGKKVDLVGFVQDGQMVPQRNEHLQIDLKFEPEADGITFQLGTAFYNVVPGGSPRPASWTGLPAGTPIDHATGGGPITIERIVGPFKKLAPGTFQVSLQKETTWLEKRYELVFAATQAGDDAFRPAVQQAHMFIPARNEAGTNQKITFPLIPNQTIGTATVPLDAVSDAHVPVSYYVRGGPAEVVGSTLLLTPIPPHAKFPVKVTVVAWQYGRSVAPMLKTADPVACAFYIVKPGAAAPPPGYVSLLPPASEIPAGK
jgi:hypothetical protein